MALGSSLTVIPYETEEHMRNGAALRRVVTELTNGCKTSHDVAAKLVAAGVVGLEGSIFACPVAEFVAQKLNAVGVRTGNERIYADGHQVPTPSVVRDFMHAFDQGTFPQLSIGRVLEEV